MPRSPSERSSTLAAGVRVRLLTGSTDHGTERITLSAGTGPAPAGAGYHPEALVPVGPWRPPTPSELIALGIGVDQQPTRRPVHEVVLVRLPDDELRAFRTIAADCRPDPARSEPDAPERHPDWDRALDTLLLRLRPYQPRDRSIDQVVMYRSDPGTATVTRVDRGDPDRERIVGLHIDGWEGTPLPHRATMRNRLGINLSSESRHFLFVNLTIADLLAHCDAPAPDDEAAITLFTAHAALRNRPDYPIVRLEVLPGEAYIAPTGNLVHDGGGAGGPAGDLALHVLGHFEVPAT